MSGARRVGLYGGLILVVLAFLPKVFGVIANHSGSGSRNIHHDFAGFYCFVHGLRLVIGRGAFLMRTDFVMGASVFGWGWDFRNQSIFFRSATRLGAYLAR